MSIISILLNLIVAIILGRGIYNIIILIRRRKYEQNNKREKRWLGAL